MNQSDNAFTAVIGIDWADTKHDFCLSISNGQTLEYGQFDHTVESINEWALALDKRFAGKPIAIVLELDKGPLVSALLPFQFITLFPVNPTSLAKYRQAFVPSRAKDDPLDAFLLLDLFRRHRERLAPLVIQSVDMRKLQQLTQARTDLRGDITQVTNRITAALKNYFPQALQLFNKKDTVVFCHFIQQWPTAPKARLARKNTLTRFFHQHNVRRTNVIEQRVKTIQAFTPLTTDAAVVDAGRLRVDYLIQQLLILIQARTDYDHRIEQLFTAMDDAHVFSSFPGAASVVAPRLMAAFGENRDRYDCAASAQKAFAVAPVMERSGKKAWVHWRTRCNKSLRQTLIEFSALSVPHSFWAKAFYDQQKEKGKSHNAILRALAFKWTRILYRCWKDRKPYDESAYLAALKKRRSPLLKHIADTTSKA